MEQQCAFCKRLTTPETSQEVKQRDGTKVRAHQLCLRLQKRIDAFYDSRAKKKRAKAINNR